MNEFLNPKSMATPGAAGALMMLIANALCNNFPEFPFRYVALILSFAIGTVVFSATKMRAWERCIYWVVNSLIIFSMGVGATNIAANVAAKQASNEHSTSVASVVMSVFEGVAFAEDGKTALPGTSDPKNQAPVTTGANQRKPSSEAELLARIKALEAQVSELKAVNKRLQPQAQQSAQQEQQRQQQPQLRSVTVQTSEPKTAPKPEAPVFFKKW